MQNEFANARSVCYLNSAAEGLFPLRSYRALEEAAKLQQTAQVLDEAQYYELPSRCRQLLSELLNCETAEIALVGSTSMGFAALAHSMPLKSGDEVLLVEKDFPSNNFAWEPLRIRDIKIRFVPFIPDMQQTSRVLESIGPATRLISISLVHFYSGFLYDLKEISRVCRDRGIFLVVDAIQAVGCMELNLKDVAVDGLCAAAHKWQLSPTGTGFLYIRKSLLPKLRPAFSGWMHNADATSFANGNFFEYIPSSQARRFELGTGPYVLQAAYEKSLQLLKECKIRYIEEHNRRLIQRLTNFFQELGWNVPQMPRSSSIFSIVPPQKYDAFHLLNHLKEKDVYVAVRNDHLRISPHFYNNEQDIDRFCEELRSLL